MVKSGLHWPWTWPGSQHPCLLAAGTQGVPTQTRCHGWSVAIAIQIPNKWNGFSPD